MPRGQPLNDEGQRRLVVDAVGDRKRLRLGGDGVLGIAAGAGQRDDPLAGVDADPGDLGAGHEGQRGAREIGVGALVGVGEVDPRPLDLDQHLVGSRLRDRQVRLPEHVGPPELADLDRAHAVTLCLGDGAANV